MRDEIQTPSIGELIRVFARVGVLSFGGPAGQIALMHRELVDDRRWLDDRTYAHALNFCMLLPGPEAMQLATYCGWRLHGVAGGLAAGTLFVMPGAVLVLALALLYSSYGSLPLVVAAFTGVKAAVLVILVQALMRVARRALVTPMHWLIAAAAFLALFAFAVPFPIIIAVAALIGFLRSDRVLAEADAVPVATPWRATVATILIWLALWWAPVGASAWLLGVDHVVTALGLFFSRLAVVTFGGAYAVLAYMAQEVVQERNWLTSGEMMDGLGLAETTPGPLILVTQFVSYLAAARQGGMITGLLGAAMTLWVTFVPCFLWIFAGAPYVERLRAMSRLSGALAAITAAVVGVILNLSLWFALHVLFGQMYTIDAWPLQLQVPSMVSFDPLVAGLAMVAAVLLLWRGLGIGAVLLITAALALTLKSVG